MAKIVLTDDHSLLRNGLAELVKSLGHTVLFEADNGKDFITKLKANDLPLSASNKTVCPRLFTSSARPLRSKL